MKAGDGLIMRIRPRMGVIPQASARGLADILQRYTGGCMTLTRRANLQIRGIRTDDYRQIVQELAALGLAGGTPGEDRLPGIMVSPACDRGSRGWQLAEELYKALPHPEDKLWRALPAKFGIAVDCGDRPVLRDTRADIRIERAPDDGRIIVQAGELPGRGYLCCPSNVVPTVLGVIRWHAETLSAQSPGQQAGATGTATIRSARVPPATATVRLRQPGEPPQPGSFRGQVMAAFAFGNVLADDMRRLAAGGALRLTPWRMIVVEGSLPGSIEEIEESETIITHPDDPRLRLHACIGSPFCINALGTTQRLAAKLVPHLPAGRHLHVSGCTKLCARPSVPAITLTATGRGQYRIADEAGIARPVPIHGTAAINHPEMVFSRQ